MSLNKLKAILVEFDKSDASKLEYEDTDLRIVLQKVTGADFQDGKDDVDDFILSPLVGSYRDATPKIKIGERVAKGQVLCIIESMKLMNKICAPAELIVERLNFRDGDSVEFNSKLFEVTYL